MNAHEEFQETLKLATEKLEAGIAAKLNAGHQEETNRLKAINESHQAETNQLSQNAMY